MKTQYQYEVISRLKKLREDKNYTQASLAKLLEISPGQLGNIESIKQEHKFTLAQILKVFDELGGSIETMFLPDREEVMDALRKSFQSNQIS